MTRTRKASHLTSIVALLSLLAAPVTQAANETENLQPQHGIAMHGEPEYPEGFSSFNYVNPDAPRGGTLKMAVVANGFDSFNPFDIRGVAAAGISTYLYDTLLESSDCLLYTSDAADE